MAGRPSHALNDQSHRKWWSHLYYRGWKKVSSVSSWLSCIYWLFKLLTNRWAWVVVPTKLGNALAWRGGIHGNPASGPHQALSHWTIVWNTYLPIPGPYLKREGGMGKNQSKKWYTNNKLLQSTLRRTASKQLHIEVTRCPCKRHWATPSIAGKTADQHCFEVNFA